MLTLACARAPNHTHAQITNKLTHAHTHTHKHTHTNTHTLRHIHAHTPHTHTHTRLHTHTHTHTGAMVLRQKLKGSGTKQHGGDASGSYFSIEMGEADLEAGVVNGVYIYLCMNT